MRRARASASSVGEYYVICTCQSSVGLLIPDARRCRPQECKEAHVPPLAVMVLLISTAPITLLQAGQESASGLSRVGLTAGAKAVGDDDSEVYCKVIVNVPRAVI